MAITLTRRKTMTYFAAGSGLAVAGGVTHAVVDASGEFEEVRKIYQVYLDEIDAEEIVAAYEAQAVEDNSSEGVSVLLFDLSDFQKRVRTQLENGISTSVAGWTFALAEVSLLNELLSGSGK